MTGQEQRRVVVVTGANRGIGLETARQLAQREMLVVLTARAGDAAREAAQSLRAEGLEVESQPLDVTDGDSLRALAAQLEQTHGRLDVLVNNAGVLLDPEQGPASSILGADLDVIVKSFETNTLGAVRCIQALVPLMQKGGYGRVVNVSTGMAALAEMNGRYPGYRLSKTALNAVTRILADELAGTNIKVNSVCPGHVQTRMGGPNAPRTVEEGVDTILWLATLRDDGPSGGFFRDCKAIAW
jgi:NAD(P)-dependent dehydrogenase (short-subunit alcohol dehydrogenase family)